MILIKSPREFTDYRNALQGTVGFVPTMGALHEGHLSLLKRSQEENTHTVLSIFVNPTQFNQKDDFEKYPTPLAQDLKLAERLGISSVFLPEPTQMYPDHYQYQVSEKSFSNQLCGTHRPGHFEGVLTIVLKLLQIIDPHRIYMGEKDYQQLKLIEGMIQAFFIPTQLIACPTLRETTGLAMSSRNERLSPEGRLKASFLYQVLKQSADKEEALHLLAQAGFDVEYLEETQGRRFIAAWLEGVRLIDNISLTEVHSASRKDLTL